MLSPKYQVNVKIAFVILVLVLMLFAEPVLGKKERSRSGKSSGSSQKAQQTKKSSAGPKVGRGANISRVRTRVSGAPRSIKSRPRPNTSKLPRRITSGRTVKSSFRQTNRRVLRGHTIHRPKTTFKASRSIRGSLGISNRSGRSFGSRRLRGTSSSTRESAAVSLNSRISSRRSSLFTRPENEQSQHIRPARERSQHVITGSRKVFAQLRPTVSRRRKEITRRRRHRFGGERSSPVIYRERSHVARHIRRHEHVYIDRHDRIWRRIVRPRYRFAVYYNWGRHFAFRYVYPYYHRKYVFVSLGGYWPVGYGYIRYYWYGCHPYRWYGYYPIAREVSGDTYNYYTYNYYNGETAVSEPCQSAGSITPVDHTTFADVRERFAQEAAEEPYEQTLADGYFEEAVKAFEANDYNLAAELFASVIERSPDDMVLPFAYCQALFASEKYMEAAEVLRAALAKASLEEEGAFYPRGLYAKDDILFEQIDQLAEKAELYSFDGDLQLLLGYQLLGVGEIDEAVKPLRRASQDLQNASSAAVLLDLLEKIRIQNADETD